MTYGEIYDSGRRKLAEAGISESGLDARLLLEYVCGTDRNDLLAHGDRPVEQEKEETFWKLLERRCRRIPLQYLTGSQYFMGMGFQVNEHVLIPRQDTEILTEEVLKYLHDGMRILDLCTGSGCILVSLLKYTNGCEGLGVDISGEALVVAEENARRLLGASDEHEYRNTQESGEELIDGATDRRESAQVRFLESDLFEKVEGTFDVIVSNPPYIPSHTIETLMPEVRDHEPRLALDGGGDGLVFYRRITTGCKTHLAGGGMLFFEIGYDQGKAVSGMMEQEGFLEVQVIKDYAGFDRVVFGTLGFGPL